MNGRLAVLLVLLFAMGCDRGGVRVIPGDLEVAPRSLDFGRVFVGFPGERSLSLKNRASADRSLTVQVAAPFSSVAQVEVPGGSEVELKVSFAPASAGLASTTLVLSDAFETFEVQLGGEGADAPVCATAATCRVSVFDSALGVCSESAAPNGTACGNACITGGSCVDGQCLGSGADCSDSNACTLDACDPNRGCSHLPIACAEPTNPCKVARCDAQTGCAQSDVRDGTACGPADCVTAQVCVLGECKPLAVPSGAKCGEATPCQGAGTCQQSVCVKPLPATLVEAWHYDFADQLDFRGVTDSAQNLYWLERDAAGAVAAVSYTRDGVLRFRTPVALPPYRAQHLVAGDLLLHIAGLDTLAALSTLDGMPRWSKVQPLQFGSAPDSADTLSIIGVAAGPTGVVLAAHRSLGPTARQNVLLKLSLSSGAPIWSRYFDGYLSVPVLDESDNVYVHLNVAAVGADVIVSIDPANTERWRVAGSSSPVAAFNSEVMLSSGSVLSAVSGAVRAGGLTGRPVNNALMSLGARLLLVEPTTQDRVNAVSIKPGVTAPDWETLVTMLHSTNFTDTVAPLAGGLLVGHSGSRHAAYLKAYDALGAERFACELPSTQRLLEGVALLDGRWAVVQQPNSAIGMRLVVYEVPGERPATRGWVGAHGAPTGNGRPLP